ncbi:nucleolar protein 11-like [Stegodyphus dumicola]|uniref:nucleolar protein 11-like n=1 Tax=Stegodyphus dumicola TaxID=202533 RepID=UPI0015AFCEFE|nr:nucleolar protein 11-like [Stegodyphus dumicola]
MKNTLIEWSAAADTLQGATKTEFQENVFCLLDVPEQKPVILFNSGKYVYSTVNSEPSGRTLFGEEAELMWADAATCESDLKIICISYKKKVKQYKLHCLSLSKDAINSANYLHQVLAHNTADLKNWCLNKINSNFYTIWSDGAVLSHRTDNNAETTPVLLIPEVEENTLLAIDVIDSSHVAVAKAGSKSKEISLEIWDSKFSTLKARKLLKATHFDYPQVSTVNSTAFLPSSEGLVAVAFHVEKSTLASVVGKSIAVSPNTKEFSWNGGKLMPASQISETNNVDIVSEESSSEKTELLAVRLLENGSGCLKFIPESELVKLLLLAIRYKSKEKGKEKIAKFDSSDLLSIIFSASFSDIFLMKCLKKLNLEETLITLELLLSFLKGAAQVSKSFSDLPSDIQIFNWICLVIQSHMEALLFTKDKKTAKLLKELDSCLSEKMEEYEDFEKIQHYFCILKKKQNILPTKFATGKYCIETLDV